MNLRKSFLLSLSLVSLIFAGCSANPVPQENPNPSNQTSDLIQIDDMEIVMRESSPVQISVVVSGNFRNGCERMGEISQKQGNNIFIITVPAKTEGDFCTQALVPFEKSIPLKTEGLADGTYDVDVNGVKESFELSGNSSADSVKTSLPTGDFKKDAESGSFYGTAYIRGYGEIKKVNESFCEEDCDQFEYVYFHVTETTSQALKDFMKEYDGNSYAGANIIGLGCYQNGTITYENDANEFATTEAGFGTKNFTLDKGLSQKIISATEEKPVALKLTKLLYTYGRGAPACYSHITQVEEFTQAATKNSQEKGSESHRLAGDFPKGTIEGSMGYPSEGIPADIKVCADNIETKETFCTTERINDKKYKYRVGYKLDVPPGKYYVYEIQTRFDYHDIPEGYKAYYSEYITCGETVLCTSHIPIVVEVQAGSAVKNIDPVDFGDIDQMKRLKK